MAAVAYANDTNGKKEAAQTFHFDTNKIKQMQNSQCKILNV